MAKRAEYEIIACQYFVECQMSIATIAKRLNISEKTLHNWKKAGNWDKKRACFLKSQYSCNQSLYELLNLVTKKALDDFKTQDIMPDQKTLYFIMNMSDKLSKLKQFEKEEAKEKIEEINKQENDNTIQNKANTQDMIKEFFNVVIGG